MGADWEAYSAGQLFDLINGYAFKSTDFKSSGVPIIKIKNVKAGEFVAENFDYVDRSFLESRPDKQVKPGDLLITMSGNRHDGSRETWVGKVAWFNKTENYLVNQRVGILRLKCSKSFNARFLAYQLSSDAFQNHFIAVATSSGGQANLSPSQITGMPLKVPCKAIQDRIAGILGALEDKIDLNRSTNQTLEAMAQAIFKSWFVDFDPVKAKIAAMQEGRSPLRAAMCAISGKPDAELDALPPEQYEQLAATAALFPDEMEESELGETPKGWAFNSVAHIAQFASGKVDVSLLNEDIYVSTENMLGNRAGVTRATSLPSVASVPSFKMGHILISNIRPYFKKIWIARFDGGRSPDVLAFEPTDLQWAEFLYNLLYQDVFFEFMTRTAKGAKMPRGDKDAIMGWRFPCPDESLMVAFSEKVRPHYAHIESLVSQSKSLTELRDTLLPKLLSGELSVVEAITGVEA